MEKPLSQYDAFHDLTGTIETEKQTESADIGKRLTMIRKEKHLSLDTLAKLTGFDAQLLQQIENNTIQPQVGTILKLSKALNKAFGLKERQPAGTQQVSITKSSDQKAIARATSLSSSEPLYQYKTLAPDVTGRHMEPLIVHLTEISAPELSIHNGEEFIYVMFGTVELMTGRSLYTLDVGDSAYYSSTVPHCLRAKDGEATILAVIYEAGPDDSDNKI